MLRECRQIDDINELLNEWSMPLNVVWQVGEISDFRQILPGFISNAKKHGSKIMYIHFSDQPVWNTADDSIRVLNVTLTHRFEAFTIAVFRAVMECEENTFFIFDSLSDLQTAWATGLMMKNFFNVITPLMMKKQASAFYPIIRGMHSEDAISDIIKETEVFLELYSDFKSIYMRPSKIMDLSAEEISLPYIYDNVASIFSKLNNGLMISRFLKAVNLHNNSEETDKKDAWDRFFDDAQRKFEEGKDITGACNTMCDIMMSRDPKIREMLKVHFKPADYFFVREHMVGTGLIGGKACGMLTARKIVENQRPDIYESFEAHDSFFIGSDVYYSYIVENDFWDLHVRQRTKEGYFSLADEFAGKLSSGKFSKKMEDQFVRLLEYYGNSPCIVRSSSILEDGFGNAFAGKYDSVFCVGAGSIEERLEEFENAIRTVYASTMSRSALDYRLRRGLQNRDEQMSLLVMRVSGSFYGDYYMPLAAGVGYSYSTYRFLESLDPKAGMLRLVMGLGTSAVDRTEGSYPRLVSLDKPAATSFKSVAEHHRYSQQNVDLINKKTGKMEQVMLSKLLPLLPKNIKNTVLEHDYDGERRFMERGQWRDIFFISCAGLVKNERLMKDIQEMMLTIQEEYGQPVDVEYAINLNKIGEYTINLLQCRPLQVFKDVGTQAIPENLPEDRVFVDVSHTSMGLSQKLDLDYIVYVDPIAYYNMPYNDKDQVAKCIGKINWHFRDLDKKMILMVPGRIGTSSPELGVPTTFSDISAFKAIFEISESKAGYNPELSYGSHIFQDLVENGILYVAVMEDQSRKKFMPEMFTGLKNCVTEIDASAAHLTDIIGLYDVKDQQAILYHDLLNEHLVCSIEGKEE